MGLRDVFGVGLRPRGIDRGIWGGFDALCLRGTC